MIRRATPKLAGHLAVVAILLVASVALGRPELAVLAAPFAVGMLIGLGSERRPADVHAAVEIDRDRALEGETIPLRLELHSPSAHPLLDVALVLPAGLAATPGAGTFASVTPAQPVSADVRLECRHWGGYARAQLAVRGRDAHGYFRDEQLIDVPFALRVYPTAEALQQMVAPVDTQLSAGNLIARSSGAGIEFADLRPFQAGDELRRVNWKATARRGSMWVTTRHPEQNTDVILFLDTFADVRDGRSGTLDLTVRAAAALAARYLQNHDRVGVVGFGGTLRWLEPGSGERRLYRIVESLITTSLVFSYAWKEVSVIPPRMLPPNALVVAISPLVDPRGVNALYDLLRRGLDVAIVEISPEPYLQAPPSQADALGLRVWRLERQELIGQLRDAGGAVASWDGIRPLDAVVEEVTRFRRHSHLAGAR